MSGRHALGIRINYPEIKISPSRHWAGPQTEAATLTKQRQTGHTVTWSEGMTQYEN